MTDRKHYQTEEEAIADLGSHLSTRAGWELYHFVAGILTIAVPNEFYGKEPPLLLLRENEGLYWEEPDI